MSWMQVLCDTYDNNAHMAGVVESGKTPLAPVFHMIANTQIEITLTAEGQFVRAMVVPKENRATIIPVTEESASRTSAPAAHPFSDTLQYLARNFAKYSGIAKDSEKSESYLQAIRAWANSAYSHQKVKAVYKYITEGDIIKDLIEVGMVQCDANGLLAKNKIEGNTYEKCLVRWRVESTGDENEAAWQDQSLFESFIQYQEADAERASALCYITGRQEPIAVNHPKGIVANSYSAKLVSAQVTSDFVYKGRFPDAESALQIGALTTQKAHNALRWLIANQAAHPIGGRTFLCWNPKGKPVPSPSGGDFLGETAEEKPKTAFTEPAYRKILGEALQGYRNILDAHDDIILMTMEAATTGRLSVTYYNELKASDFLDRMENWYRTCCWYAIRFDTDKKPFWVVETPVIKRIVEAAFGHEGSDFIEVDDRLLHEHAQRLLHCIVDAQPLPDDMVRAVTVRASLPEAYQRGNRERVLSAACALIRKHHNDLKGKEEIKMELDVANTNRSYLFGRLLAIAEKVERSTFSREENREPNAIRLQTVFQEHPLHTWRNLETAIRPYLAQLRTGSREYYRKLTAEIVSELENGDVNKLNQPLEDIYLIGYYLQRRELNTYVEKTTQED